MRSSVIHGCGSPVVYLGKRVCVSTTGLPQPIVSSLMGVNKSIVFYSACVQVLHGVIHDTKDVFSSVKSGFMHIVHRPYNNKEIFKYFYLLFIRRTK